MSKQSRRGTEWEKTRQRILTRDGRRCAYCGKDNLAGADATVDHILPIEHGGGDDDANLVAACRTCNGRKTDKVLTRMPWFNPRWLERL